MLKRVVPQYRWVLLLVCGACLVGCGAEPDQRAPIRVMTYNIEDVRTEDVKRADHPRLQRAAGHIQALAPDILLVNEITYDQPGAPGHEEGDASGQNARRFVENYLSVPQGDRLVGQSYRALMLPVNTGRASGFDLNNDGRVVTDIPQVRDVPEDGRVRRQTEAEQAYGNDAWGFGTFPGQYGMALLVRHNIDIVRDSIRTFRLFRWSAMPHAAEPRDSVTGKPWYTAEEWDALRLSSKSHWDIPVRLPDGSVLHVLASHPTPPAFDGPAQRNARRNHDEIRFWVDYIRGAQYVEDDSSRSGGLHDEASFIILGDLNADPDDSGLFRTAIRDLLSHDQLQDPVPVAPGLWQAAFPDLDPRHTARWGKRVDYVLPSTDLAVDTSGVFRPGPSDSSAVSTSDHFPVWVDVKASP